MDLNFTKIDNLWVAEFSVSGEFNLHLERNEGGQLNISQRTAGSNYEHIEDAHQLDSRLIFDADFQGLIYPKWIKIKSAVKPLVATITTDGEVNEVVYQAKDIEITSNGTTKVTADTGYTALGSVNVKVNVPQSGEGGGQNEMRYFALFPNSFDAVYFSTLARYKVDGSTLIGPTLMYAEDSESIEGAKRCIEAAAFNFNTKIRYGNVYNNLFEFFGISSVEEFIDRFGVIKEITEEQFYDPDFNPFA